MSTEETSAVSAYQTLYKSWNGFISERRIYECEDCYGRPVKGECTRAHYNRRIQIGVELDRLKQMARDNL